MNEPFILGNITLYQGDCLEVVKTLPANSISSIITDPPYHLTALSRGGSRRNNDPNSPYGRHNIGADKGFMGKTWDGGDIAFRKETWEVLATVCKPGAYLLSFGGCRTFHRLVCAIEDAKWKIIDQIIYCFGTGFPKSLGFSRKIKEMFEIYHNPLIEELEINQWTEISRRANHAEKSFLKNLIEIGTSTIKNDFVLTDAMETVKAEKLSSSVNIAGRNSEEAQPSSEVKTFIVLENVEVLTKQVFFVAKYARKNLKNQSQFGVTSIVTVVGNVWELLKEPEIITNMDDDPQTIWRGKQQFCDGTSLPVSCAALIKNLNLIILNLLKIIQNSSTKLTMERLTATNVIITKSTMECLITLMPNYIHGRYAHKKI